MTTNYHTPLGDTDFNTSGVNVRLSDLDSGITGVDGEIDAARTAIPHAISSPPNTLGDSLSWMAGNVANVMAFGATGDGVTDDTAAIQNAVTNYEIIYFPPGTYICNDLNVPANRMLFAHKGATLLTTLEAGHVLIIAGEHVTLRGLRFEGADADEHGILINLEVGDLDNIRVEGCEFTRLFSCVRIKSFTEINRIASNVFVTDNYFHNIEGRVLDCKKEIVAEDGVVYSLDNIHFERNTLIDIAPESSGSEGPPPAFPGAQGNTGAIHIANHTSVVRFYICDNVVYRAGPQFVCMRNPGNQPRVDFVIRGNTVRQQGSTNVIHMGYQLYGIDNLIFADNSVYYVEFECMLMANCRNYKITGCHFEDGNVGIAIVDNASYHRSYGEISNCTFVDIECPTGENNGNKGIYLESDGGEVDINNCRFTSRNGAKAQTGIDIGYDNSPPRYARSFSLVDFEWVSAGDGTYYLKKTGGYNPRVSLPVSVYELAGANSILLTQGILSSGTLGSAGQWTYGDGHALGYDTIYVRLSDSTAPTTTKCMHLMRAMPFRLPTAALNQSPWASQ